ncbi:MAG TPA: LURP-one-related family protein [Streptosporangiaceae bacterium]
MREKLFSIGGDFWITDQDHNKVLLVDGKALSMRERLELKDADGNIVATVRKKLMAMRETMQIDRDGDHAATVRKELFSPLRHRSVIDLADGGQLEASGDILAKEFEISDGSRALARISRAWFRLRDTYGVDVAPGEDDVLMLAVAVALDRIHRDEEARRDR